MATKREVMEAAARGEGCLGRAEDDEPVFVLRGKDALAARTVRHWASLAEDVGSPEEKTTGAREVADAMDAWPNHKRPD